mgnify:CR=1 FL=1
MIARVGIEYDRPLPEEWERRLWTIAPPSNFVSWLLLRWEPGDPWEPIERWVIWQMRHPRFLRRRPDIVQELRGPHPRSTGHFCSAGPHSQCGIAHCYRRTKRESWYGGAARQIDRAQWELFRDTGHVGTRWWVIQGDNGGHRHRLDEIETRITRIMTKGKVSDTPAPGDLPYADFDSRTFVKVAALDKVRMWKGVTDYVYCNAATMDAAERDEGEAAQRALWAWLESQVNHTVQTIGRSGVQALRDAAPRVLDKPKPLDEDAMHEDFITQSF